jgi:hypothetical protein
LRPAERAGRNAVRAPRAGGGLVSVRDAIRPLAFERVRAAPWAEVFVAAGAREPLTSRKTVAVVSVMVVPPTTSSATG